VFPSVNVTFRSALKVIFSVSVAVLFAVFGSLIPAGAVTCAVFDSVPVAAELSLPLALQMILLAEGIVTISLMLPLPLAVKPVAPPAWVAVNVRPVSAAGKLSDTDAPFAAAGPTLVTTMV